MPTRNTLYMIAALAYLVAMLIGLSGFTKKNGMFTGARISDNARRWRVLLALTLLINLFTFLLTPALTCGCHFWWGAFYASLVPFLWGFYPLTTYKNRTERNVAYLAVTFSMLWVVLSAIINPWPILGLSNPPGSRPTFVCQTKKLKSWMSTAHHLLSHPATPPISVVASH